MPQDHGPWGGPDAPSRPERPGRAPQGGERPRWLLWLVLLGALGGLVAALAHAFPEAVRTSDDWASVARSAGFLVLVSAGVVRWRGGLRAELLGHAAVWAGIIALLALGFAYRDLAQDAGQRLRLAFSAGDPVAVSEHEMVIPQSGDGAFVVVGRVNGQRVRFVVDTGATDTVLSPDDARRIGVDVDALRYEDPAETANGLGYSAAFTADRLEVGAIRLEKFRLAVNRTPLSASLLGMSFLRRLESFRVEKGALVLRWREGDDPAV